MMDGLHLSISPHAHGWVASLDGKLEIFAATAEKARKNWINLYGEDYGVDTKKQEYTVVLPLKDTRGNH